MRTIFSRTLFAGLALVAFATGAAAQDRTALLTSIEVKTLVARAQPDDHARVRDHFAALADRYTVAAQRQKAMARVLTGNPNHPPAVTQGFATCDSRTPPPNRLQPFANCLLTTAALPQA